MNDDYISLVAKGDLTRREFVVTTLATGFALAVRPVSAQTITTSSSGLIAGEVKIPVSDGEIPGYWAIPAKGRSFPVILVVQEIFGVHEHIKDICRRFAKLGHMAIAPELYARHGDVSKITDINAIIRDVVSKVPDSEVMSDLDATVEFARKSGKGNVDKLGITGFCWGGRVVWMYSRHNPRVKAGAAWYGRLVGASNPMTPQNPVDIAATLKTPVIGFYGGKDQGIPLDTIEKMRAGLKTGGNPSEIIVYPNAQHGFNADYRPSYDKQSAEDAWNRLQMWFKKFGAA